MLESIGTVLKVTAEILVEVATGLFNQGDSDRDTDSPSQATYDYWMSLDYRDQEDYFKSNEYLKDYIQNDYYPNSRELTAKHVQYIADKLNRDFTNKYNRF